MQQSQNSSGKSCLILILFMVVSLVAISLIFLLPSEYRDPYFTILVASINSLLVSQLVFRWWPRTKRVGSLLYKVGFDITTFGSYLIFTGVYIFLAFLNLSTFSNTRDPQLWNYLGISFWFLLIIYWLGRTLNRIELRENGILSDGSFTEWDNIASFDWTGKDYQTLSLKLKKSRLSKTRSFQIPRKDGVAVNRIMAEKVLGWHGQVSPQS